MHARTDTGKRNETRKYRAKPQRQDACLARHQQIRNSTNLPAAAAKVRRPVLLRACSIVRRPRNLCPRVAAPLARRAMQDLPACQRHVSGFRVVFSVFMRRASKSGARERAGRRPDNPCAEREEKRVGRAERRQGRRGRGTVARRCKQGLPGLCGSLVRRQDDSAPTPQAYPLQHMRRSPP